MAGDRLGEITGQWLEKAGRDLAIVERDTNQTDPITDVLCFHCQQAAEKYLKAFLVSHLIKPPRDHNIKTLIDLCAEIDVGFTGLNDTAYLSDYAVDVRYPDDFYIPSVEELRTALEDARRIRSFVMARIPLRKE